MPTRNKLRLLIAAMACAFANAPVFLDAQTPKFRSEGDSQTGGSELREVPPPFRNNGASGDTLRDTPSEPAFRNNGPVPTGTDELHRIPRGEYQDTPVGVPYSSIFRDTSPPYTHSLRDLRFEPSLRAENIDGSFFLDLPGIHGSFPLLDRGFSPDDADIKFGPVYFKLRALGLGVLHSDNIHHDENNRESDTIGIVRITGTILAQLSEGFRIAASGSFVYLPFEGSAGVSGFGLLAPYSFGLEGIPIARTQVTWDTKIGGWDVTFADEFRVGVGRYSSSTHDDFEFFEGGTFDDVDRAGRYSFSAPRHQRERDRFTSDNEDTDFTYFSNIASVETQRLLPGEVRLRVRGLHENLWYNQGGRGLPHLRDEVMVRLQSERENMRFKPYFSYRTGKTDQREGWNQIVHFGIDGPITDQLDLHAAVGWYMQGNNDAQRFLYELQLRHVAGPYTVESLTAGRRVSDFYDEIHEGIAYHIYQILGPDLRAEAFIHWGLIEDLDDEGRQENLWRTGLRLTYRAGPKTLIRASGIYAERDSDFDGDSQTWTGRLELSYNFTDTLLGRFIYQYQRRESSSREDSYYENLLYLTITKYFD